MKKGMILVTAAVLLSTVAWAAEGDAEMGDIGVDVDLTFVSKYIWRGIDKLDDTAAFQPSINFDLGSGFSTGIWASIPGGGGTMASGSSRVNAEEWRYILTYGSSTFEGESYRTTYAVNYIYYDFPDMASNDADAQEINLALSWPDICPAGVVPSYTLINMWPAEGSGANRDIAGFIHVVGLGYDVTVPGFLQDNPEQILSFGAAAVYNDNAGASNVDHDWSHILWSATTSIDFGPGTLTPGLYYQTSMDDSVNTEDELFCGISYGISF